MATPNPAEAAGPATGATLPTGRWADVPVAALVTARAFGRFGHRPGRAGAVLAVPLASLLAPQLAAAAAQHGLLVHRDDAGTVAVAQVRRPEHARRTTAVVVGGAVVLAVALTLPLIAAQVALGLPDAAVLVAVGLLLAVAVVDALAHSPAARGRPVRIGVSPAVLAARLRAEGHPAAEVAGFAAWPPGRRAGVDGLLRPALQVADREGLTLTLAARRPELVPLYARFGWRHDAAGPLVRPPGAGPQDPAAPLLRAGTDMAELADRAGVPAPPVLVVPRLAGPVFALRAAGPLDATVRVHPAVLAAPSTVRRQLLAHELAHVQLHHQQPAAAGAAYGWLTAAAGTAGLAALAAALPPAVPALLGLPVLLLVAAMLVLAGRAAARSRRLEHEADRWAADLCNQPVVAEHLHWSARRRRNSTVARRRPLGWWSTHPTWPERLSNAGVSART